MKQLSGLSPILLTKLAVVALLVLQMHLPCQAQERPPEFEQSNKLVLLGIKAFRAGKVDLAETRYKEAYAALEPLNGPKTDLARMGILKNLHLIYEQQGKKELAKAQIDEITAIEKRCGLPVSNKSVEEPKPAQELKADVAAVKVQKKAVTTK